MNNREIEFRAKCTITREFKFGYYIEDSMGPQIISKLDGSAYNVIPGTVGQYTGLKDKNDVKIYEGDIVYFSIFDHNDNDTQFTGVVKYVDGMFEVWHDDKCEYYGNDGAFILGFVAEQDEEMSIIGNIHDKPELLEGI